MDHGDGESCRQPDLPEGLGYQQRARDELKSNHAHRGQAGDDQEKDDREIRPQELRGHNVPGDADTDLHQDEDACCGLEQFFD